MIWNCFRPSSTMSDPLVGRSGSYHIISSLPRSHVERQKHASRQWTGLCPFKLDPLVHMEFSKVKKYGSARTRREYSPTRPVRALPEEHRVIVVFFVRVTTAL